jgi:hypothetical protein
MFVVMAVLYVPWRATLWVGSFFFTIPAAQLGASCPDEPPHVHAVQTDGQLIALGVAGFLAGMADLMVQCWVIVPTLGLSFFRFASGTIFAYSEIVYFTVLAGTSAHLAIARLQA